MVSIFVVGQIPPIDKPSYASFGVFLDEASIRPCLNVVLFKFMFCCFPPWPKFPRIGLDMEFGLVEDVLKNCRHRLKILEILFPVFGGVIKEEVVEGP